MAYNVVMDTFAALGDATRRTILEMLARRGQLSATEIYDKFPVSHPAISQHLKVLREANLVQVTKRAQQRIYAINPDPLLKLAGWIKQMTQVYDERFDALDKILAVEKEKMPNNPLTQGDEPK